MMNSNCSVNSVPDQRIKSLRQLVCLFKTSLIEQIHLYSISWGFLTFFVFSALNTEEGQNAGLLMFFLVMSQPCFYPSL